jgi:hypothetical protein
VADHDDFADLIAHLGDFDVYLGDQRAGGANQIDSAQLENHNDHYDQYE